MTNRSVRVRATASVVAMLGVVVTGGAAQRTPVFDVHEATIAGIRNALQAKRVTTVGIVEQYLRRIKAYNGVCVNEPKGILGPITTIPHAGQINALSTPPDVVRMSLVSGTACCPFTCMDCWSSIARSTNSSTKRFTTCARRTRRPPGRAHSPTGKDACGGERVSVVNPSGR